MNTTNKSQHKGYQGHRNWNAWNVSLWISNEYGLYRLALDCIRGCSSRDEAARRLLDHLPEKTPDGAPYTFTTVRAALVGL